MVKNWIILGDAALDDADWTIGKIDFSQDEVPNWKKYCFGAHKSC